LSPRCSCASIARIYTAFTLNDQIGTRTRPGRHAPRPDPIYSETISAYSEANQRRIYDACPHATEVHTFHGWLAAGRVVSKGQKGIRIVAPDNIDDSGKLRSNKAVSVFDMTQMQVRTPRAASRDTTCGLTGAGAQLNDERGPGLGLGVAVCLTCCILSASNGTPDDGDPAPSRCLASTAASRRDGGHHGRCSV